MTVNTRISRAIKAEIIELSYKHKLGHIASALSMSDYLYDFFSETYRPERGDMLYVGKPYGAQAFHVVMGMLNMPVPPIEFSGLQQAENDIHFVEATLGNALGIASGVATAKLLKQEPGTVYVINGDAAMTQGCNWEAVQLASKYELTNLHMIVDNNGMGILEKDPMLEDMAGKLRAFGWTVNEPDYNGKPSATVYNTTKGDGISFMENNPEWHYKVLDEEHYKKAMSELI